MPKNVNGSYMVFGGKLKLIRGTKTCIEVWTRSEIGLLLNDICYKPDQLFLVEFSVLTAA